MILTVHVEVHQNEDRKEEYIGHELSREATADEDSGCMSAAATIADCEWNHQGFGRVRSDVC